MNFKNFVSVFGVLMLAGCAAATDGAAVTGSPATAGSTQSASAGAATSATAPSAAAPTMTMGNGDKNWIVVDGAVRDDNTITFKEVQIDGNGWLVMHPFEEGKPNGDKYVASTYVRSGNNKEVNIKVHKGAATGEMFIVMLHRDLNENRVFDFVFVDEVNVMDRAVFEGTRMIGHAVPAP